MRVTLELSLRPTLTPLTHRASMTSEAWHTHPGCRHLNWGFPYLKVPRVYAVVALDEGIPKVVDAILEQALQRPVVKVQVVWIPAVKDSQGHANI